jgi:CheY-like chemotaxis protein
MDGLLKILLVDDDVGDRKQMIRAMRQAGLTFEVVETANVTDAIAACEKQEFDCSIVDYRMPGQDGLKAIPVFHRQPARVMNPSPPPL